MGAGFAAFKGAFSKGNMAFAALGLPENIRQTKGYIGQQRMARASRISAPQAAGEIPNMQKLSARKALRFYMRKHAVFGASTLTGALGKALLLGAAGTAAGALVGSGIGGVGGVFQQFQASRMFRELQARYPEIKKHPKAREYFDMIVAYAPSLLRHHAAVGDFLRRQLEYPMTSVEFLKQLADLEGQVMRSGVDALGSRIGQTMGATGPKWMEQVMKASGR